MRHFDEKMDFNCLKNILIVDNSFQNSTIFHIILLNNIFNVRGGNSVYTFFYFDEWNYLLKESLKLF